MKTFKIFSNPQGNQVAVKKGWSWPGFLFTVVWALVKKMWVLGGGLLFTFIVLGYVEATISEESAVGISVFSYALSIILFIIFGANGNKWLEKKLMSRGYDYQGKANAETPEGAIALWLKQIKDGKESE